MTEQKYVVDVLLQYLAAMPGHPWKVIRLQKTQSPAELRGAIKQLNSWL